MINAIVSVPGVLLEISQCLKALYSPNKSTCVGWIWIIDPCFKLGRHYLGSSSHLVNLLQSVSAFNSNPWKLLYIAILKGLCAPRSSGDSGKRQEWNLIQQNWKAWVSHFSKPHVMLLAHRPHSESKASEDPLIYRDLSQDKAFSLRPLSPP